jgi:methionyl-tRNA formyltransferase
MLTYRQVHKSDLKLLFDWVNDPAVRGTAINTKLISFEDHKLWFSEKLKDKNCYIYIYQKNNLPIGQVCIEKKNEKHVISYSVDAAERGKGYGKEMLLDALVNFFLEKGKSACQLEAYVGEFNAASLRIFNSLNFLKEGTVNFSGKNFFHYIFSKERFKIDYIIGISKPENYGPLFYLLKKEYSVFFISTKDRLSYKLLKLLSPKFIFFPHWSYLIPDLIYDSYNCVIFHMTDLPFGRGGSPLQNLIIGGHKKTKISAIKVVKEIDAGPVYLKRNLSLHGSAFEICERASIVIADMIKKIATDKIKYKPQKGKVTYFHRRKPGDSDISSLSSLNKVNSVYDHIRMLDAYDYPHAYIQMGKLKFEFTNAKIDSSGLTATVRITNVLKKNSSAR